MNGGFGRRMHFSYPPEACLRAQPDKLYHMGIRCTVARNTLANANAVCNWRIYAEFAQRLMVSGVETAAVLVLLTDPA